MEACQCFMYTCYSKLVITLLNSTTGFVTGNELFVLGQLNLYQFKISMWNICCVYIYDNLIQKCKNVFFLYFINNLKFVKSCNAELGMVAPACNSSPWEVEQKDQAFKAILDCIGNTERGWAACDFLNKPNKIESKLKSLSLFLLQFGMIWPSLTWLVKQHHVV